MMDINSSPSHFCSLTSSLWPVTHCDSDFKCPQNYK